MDRTAQNAVFNPLTFSTALEAVGVPEKQAKKHAQLLYQTLTRSFVTRRDLERLELRLTIKLGVMQAVAVGILATLIKLI